MRLNDQIKWSDVKIFPSFTQMNEWHLKRQYLQIVQKSALVVAKRWPIVSGTIFLNNHSTSYPTKKRIFNLVLYIRMLKQ